MSPILSCLHADRHIPLILHHIPTDSPSSSSSSTPFYHRHLFPQRQHFPHFPAVAASPFSPHPCYRPSGQHPPPRPLSTTAVFLAFRCRCGIAFCAEPHPQAFRTASPLCPLSTTAAFPAFPCRCGTAFCTAPRFQQHTDNLTPQYLLLHSFCK